MLALQQTSPHLFQSTQIIQDESQSTKKHFVSIGIQTSQVYVLPMIFQNPQSKTQISLLDEDSIKLKKRKLDNDVFTEIQTSPIISSVIPTNHFATSNSTNSEFHQDQESELHQLLDILVNENAFYKNKRFNFSRN